MRIRDSITIDAPAARVFDGWADLERAPEHQKASLERIKITEGPVEAGTRCRAIDQWPGRKVSFEMEIIDFRRPNFIAARWESPMEGGWTARFAEGPDGTVWTSSSRPDRLGLWLSSSL